MILVDTSVLIDFLRNRENDKTRVFARFLDQKVSIGFSHFTYQEVLQGARDEADYRRLKRYLYRQTYMRLTDDLQTYEWAARIYYDLRRMGKTVRSAVDVLIALTAVQNDSCLLHNDRDFDNIAVVLPELIIVS